MRLGERQHDAIRGHNSRSRGDHREMKLHSTSVISDFDGRRDNNFTLLRLIFASAVLFGHGFAIARNGLDRLADPITRALGNVWIGDIAVSGFFAISGFLVAASFARNSIVRFALLRSVRIFPALIACVAICISVGAAITTLPTADYFSSPITWDYAKNVSLYQVHNYLPGVFEGNPFNGGVNGSLWSLPVEIRCYLLLMIAGFFGLLDSRLRVNVAAVLALIFVNNYAVPMWAHPNFVSASSYFTLGLLVWTNRHFIPLHSGAALLSCVVLVATAKVPSLSIVFAAALVYLIFYVALAVRHVNLDRFGDISYGVYIYAWPVQQFVWTEGQSGYGNFMIAAPLTFALATASWFMVEKPSLALIHRKTRPSKPATLEAATLPKSQPQTAAASAQS